MAGLPAKSGPGNLNWGTEDASFLKSIGKIAESENPRQLIASWNHLLVAWSDQHRCLIAVDFGAGANVNRVYKLTLSHEVNFRVDRMSVSAGGYLLLWGSGGTCVVALPHNDVLAVCKVDRPVQCKSWGIGELLLMQNPGMEILSVQWMPDSALHVVVLSSDNCLRLFDISKKQMRPLVTVQVLRRALSLSRMSFGMAAATGGQLVDFAFGKTTGEVFCLTASGSVFRVSDLRPDAQCKPTVSKRPLVMLPEVDDNFGSDGYALLSLDCGPANCTVLVLGGSRCDLYHCLVLPDCDEDRAEDEAEIHIFEELKLNLTFFEAADQSGDIRCPIVLQRDPWQSNRYFAHHDSGVHVVIVPLTERLSKLVNPGGDANPDIDGVEAHNEDHNRFGRSECSLVEQVVCTRANDSSPMDSPPGLCVVLDLPTPWLTVLTSGMKIINIPLSRYQFVDNVKQNVLLSEEPLAEEQNQQTAFTDYEQEIRSILTGSRVPVLAQTQKVTAPKELLELALQTTQKFREEHMAQLGAAKQLLMETSRSLRTAKESQLEEMQQLETAMTQIEDRAAQFGQRLAKIEKRKTDAMLRLQDVMQTVQRKKPSTMNPQMIKDFDILNDRVNRIASVLSSTQERMSSWKESPQICEKGSAKTRDPFASMGHNQKASLEARLEENGHEISKMQFEIKELMADLE